MTNEKNKPVHKLKLGSVNASVFANPDTRNPDANVIRYSVAVDRTYMKDGPYKRTSTFPEQELDNIELAIQRCKHWIAENRQ